MLPAMTRRHDVTLLSGAILVSALGDFLALIPLALALQRTTGSGVVVAGLFIALWTPVVALAGPAGLLVDRGDPRRIVVAAAVGQAGGAGALAVARPRAPPRPRLSSASRRAPAAAPRPRSGPSSRSSPPSPATAACSTPTGAWS